MTQSELNFDSRETQTANILRHLQSGRSINPLESLRLYGCFRLGARIWDLRKEGFEIQRKMVKTPTGKSVASYWLEAK